MPIRPGTFHAPGLPKEWNAIIDQYVDKRKKRDREELAHRPKRKRKGDQSKRNPNADSKSRYKDAKNDTF